jgi:hypothetical protein
VDIRHRDIDTGTQNLSSQRERVNSGIGLKKKPHQNLLLVRARKRGRKIPVDYSIPVISIGQGSRVFGFFG